MNMDVAQITLCLFDTWTRNERLDGCRSYNTPKFPQLDPFRN